MCDIVQNFFLAKTRSVRIADGWNPALKTFEHEDFFIQMKLSCLKVAVCPTVTAYHGTEAHPWIGYREKRDQAFQVAIWYHIKYGINYYTLCKKTTDVLQCKKIAYSFYVQYSLICTHVILIKVDQLWAQIIVICIPSHNTNCFIYKTGLNICR